MFLGFLAIFVIGGAHVLLESLGIWRKLPTAVVHLVDSVTGFILILELVGQLAVLGWKPRPLA